jgi:hypothetical protein
MLNAVNVFCRKQLREIWGSGFHAWLDQLRTKGINTNRLSLSKNLFRVSLSYWRLKKIT